LFEQSQSSYAQYLLELTYEHKLSETSVDVLNSNTENLFRTFISNAKVTY
jgi:hypothetical protein